MSAKLVDSPPGTIISIALHIFRSELKGYLSLAGGAFLWSLLPIYGWAKSNQMAAVISVKAYQKLVGIEESTKDITRRLSRKLWSFWALNILGGFYVSFVYLVCLFILFLLNDLIFQWADKFFSRDFGISLLLGFMTFLASLQVFLLTSGLFFWLYGRVCFAELPLAIEPDRSVFGSIARAWHLSRGRGRKIQTIFSIGSIILSVLLFNLPSIFFTFLITTLAGGWVITYIFFWSLFVALLQILKAVIYYDLRCFREGIDLRLAVNK